MAELDPVKMALDITLKIKQLVDAVQPRKTDALSRRARELPTLVLQTGLIPALTFYLSKVEKEEVYKLVLEALEAKVDKSKLEELSEEDKKKVREEVGGEGKGYTTLLGISAYMLKQLADMYKIEKCKNINTIVGFVECLHEIRNNRGKEVILEKQFMKFMLEVKKLFDAFFREK